MKFLPKIALITSLLLPSCTAFQDFIMVPSDHRKNRDCVYHDYKNTPHCSQYRFIPVDKPAQKTDEVSNITKITQNKTKPIANYEQYKGDFRRD